MQIYGKRLQPLKVSPIRVILRSRFSATKSLP
jgi:hypothetical protein